MENFGDAASISGSAPPSLHQKGLSGRARSATKIEIEIEFYSRCDRF